MRNLILIFIILMLGMFYLFYYNPHPVPFQLGGKEITTYIPLLMGISFLIGVIFSFLLQLFSLFSDWAHDTFMKFKTSKERKAKQLLSSAKEAFERGDVEEALRKVKECVKLKTGSPDIAVFLAKLKMATSSIGEAVKILKDEVSKENPSLEAVLLYLDLSLREELPDAIEIGRKKLSKESKSPLLLRAMARACDRYHLHEEAIEYQKRLLKMDGWDRDTERRFYAYLLFRSGEEKINSGDEEGIKLIKESMNFLPYFTPAVNELIKIHVKNGDVKKAKELAEEAFSKTRSHFILLSLEKELLDANMPAEAVGFYTRLCEMVNDPALRFLTARLLLKLEKMEHAEEILKEIPQELAEVLPFRYLYAVLSSKKGDISSACKVMENIIESECFNMWGCTVCKWKGAVYTPVCPNCRDVDSIRMQLI